MRWVADGRRYDSGWFDCDNCGTFDVPGTPNFVQITKPSATH
jgi:hypothetical protein